MHPRPRLSEKKAWPRAPRMTEPLILLKSGAKRNVSPSAAPGIISELTQNTIKSTKRTGISTFDTRSMPLATPRARITKFTIRKTSVHISGRQLPVENSSKRAW